MSGLEKVLLAAIHFARNGWMEGEAGQVSHPETVRCGVAESAVVVGRRQAIHPRGRIGCKEAYRPYPRARYLTVK